MRVVGTVGDGYRYLSPCSSLTHVPNMWFSWEVILKCGVRGINAKVGHFCNTDYKTISALQSQK